MEELVTTLAKIQDAEFVTTTCIEAPMTNLTTTKRILSYAKERLVKATQVLLKMVSRLYYLYMQ